MNLIKKEFSLETINSEEKYFQYNPPKEKLILEETRQLFLNSVLTECLTDGTPAYYNSNILGRYYRKDYHDFGDSPGTDAD